MTSVSLSNYCINRFTLGDFLKKVIWQFKKLLHNYLFTYRDEHNISDKSPNDMTEESNIERDIFQNDCTNRVLQSMVVGNDGGRPSCRPSATYKYYKLQGVQLKNKLHISLIDHDMHCPRQEEWYTNVNAHVVKNC